MNKEHLHPEGRPYTQEEFINKIKTDDEFAKKWGDLGPIYGKQWRNWDIKPNIETKSYIHKGETHFTFDINERQPIDQIANSINLLKIDPDSRRNKVSAWNVGELDEMVLPPCHTDFQFFTRELSLKERLQVWDSKFGFANDEQKNQFNTDVHLDTHGIPKRAISLMWNQRSVDTGLGLPFNIASYGLLLEIIAKEVNMVPDELIGNLGDTHLYSNHIEQAKEQIGRELSLEERLSLVKNNVMSFDELSKANYDEFFKKNNIPNRTREPYPLPTLKIVGYPEEYKHPNDERLFEEFDISDFQLENYQSHPTIKMPLSN
jgi:thymidylate synthase